MGWTETENLRLDDAQKQGNATEIWNILGGRGWSVNAVAAILGNMQVESSINPNVWEGYKVRPEDTSLGFGLVQWTPANKIRSWLRSNGYAVSSGSGQCHRLYLEMEEGLAGQYFINKNKLYPISRTAFIKSTEAPQKLASAFMYNYERPSAEAVRLSEADRRKYAGDWYLYLSGVQPEPDPDPQPPPPSPSQSAGIYRNWNIVMHSAKRLNGQNKRDWFR
ncbi:phage tail tip lysozyme [Bacteroides acidifaciens]|uniref:phage tail tip lysozyme n=1 Tax=Bacteroides acidifaciens TaxID=85831 RepID=UPI0025ADDB93|nr:phage tail tip lysozyme [Bacteroides acidifaciens]